MTCKNCHNSLSYSSDYCNNCGAKVIRNRLTVKNLFASFSEQFLNYDNKFLQTFINLFRKPEDVIGSYINGTRKKYVNVISYFAIAITFSGLQIYVMQKFGVNYDTYINPDPNIAKFQEEFNNSLFKFISEYQAIIMMLYMPFYALLAKLIFFKNKTLNYTELLVLFMYGQAQISIVLAVLTIILIPLGFSMTFLGIIVLPLQIIYFAFCLKRVYNLTLPQIILKTIIFSVIAFILMIILIIIILFVMYKAGVLDELIEAQKQAIGAKKALEN